MHLTPEFQGLPVCHTHESIYALGILILAFVLRRGDTTFLTTHVLLVWQTKKWEEGTRYSSLMQMDCASLGKPHFSPVL